MFTELKNLIRIYKTNDEARKIMNLEMRQLVGYFFLWAIVYIIYLILL